MGKLMRTVYAIAMISLLSIHANAQFKKGTIMLGTTVGTTGYSSAGSDYNYDAGELRSAGNNTFTFSIGPQVGVFLSPRLVLGATPAFTISSSHATNHITNPNSTISATTTHTMTTTVTLGPYVRYYFTSLTGDNWFYGQINASIGSGGGSTSGTSNTTTTTGNTSGTVSDILTWNAGASIGMTHFFYKRIGMDIAVGYNYSHVHNYDVNNTSTINNTSGKITVTSNNYALNTATNGVTLGVGFHWFLKG
jgi:Outer membrane protein beta-barrel domain